MDELDRAVELAKDCKGDLIRISESFKEVAVNIKAVEDIVKKIEIISCGRLPKCEIGDLSLPRNDMTDDSYAKCVAGLFSKRSDEERMEIIISMMGKLVNAVRDYERKIVKLDERIRMQECSPERIVAIRQKQKINETVKVLNRRIENLIDRFFKFRKTMLLRILGQTEKLTGLFFDDVTGYAQPYRDMFKNKLKSELVIEQYKVFNQKFKIR